MLTFNLAGVVVSLLPDRVADLRVRACPTLPAGSRYVRSPDGEILGLPEIQVSPDEDGRLDVDLVSPLAPGITPSGWLWLVTVDDPLRGAVYRQALVGPGPGETVVLGNTVPLDLVESVPRDELQALLDQLAAGLQGPPGPQGERGPVGPAPDLTSLVGTEYPARLIFVGGRPTLRVELPTALSIDGGGVDMLLAGDSIIHTEPSPDDLED